MTDNKYIFGPVPSRRLGRSLGINIIPSKICSMDCIYCEVGKTNALTMKRAAYYKSSDILQELRSNLPSLEKNIDVITITGAGEPTLNSELQEILKGIKSLTDKKVAILTNATLFDDEEVYNTLLQFDIVVPSLDAVSIDEYDAINKPHKSVNVDKIIKSLEKFSQEYKGILYLEILICKGVNDSNNNIDKLIEVSKNIKATKMQIGTVFRPPAYSSAISLSDDELLEIVNKFRKSGLNAEVSGAFKNVYNNVEIGDIDTLVLNLLKMRPCTLVDIESVSGASNKDILDIIDKLIKSGEVVASSHNNETYYNHLSIDKLKTK